MRRLNRETVPHYLRIALQMVSEFFSTLAAYYMAWWWRIDIGQGCTFVGRPLFRRTPGASISIGSDCRFLSSFSSNLHGLNHPCIITAATPKARVRIGDRVGMSGTVIFSAAAIQIGDRTFIGANCTITDTDSHSLDFRDRTPDIFGRLRDGWREPVGTAPIKIAEDVFIGTGCLVLKGVTIGKGAVIGAGSVVAKDVPAYCVAAGAPARPIRCLRDQFPGIEEPD